MDRVNNWTGLYNLAGYTTMAYRYEKRNAHSGERFTVILHLAVVDVDREFMLDAFIELR